MQMDIPPKALLVEAVGTFVFVCAILQFHKHEFCAFPIAAALCGSILFAGGTSGAHLNPVVSAAMYMKNDEMKVNKMLAYWAAQTIGAAAAAKFIPTV